MRRQAALRAFAAGAGMSSIGTSSHDTTAAHGKHLACEKRAVAQFPDGFEGYVAFSSVFVEGAQAVFERHVGIARRVDDACVDAHVAALSLSGQRRDGDPACKHDGGERGEHDDDGFRGFHTVLLRKAIRSMHPLWQAVPAKTRHAPGVFLKNRSLDEWRNSRTFVRNGRPLR